jgi:hypothetical protein
VSLPKAELKVANLSLWSEMLTAKTAKEQPRRAIFP